MNGTRETLGVYIHIPFCVKKCGYCDFYSVPAQIKAVSDYIEALTADIRASHFGGRVVDTVYFGGGTPTLIGADALSTALDALRGAAAVDDNAEITFEANPATIDQSGLMTLRRAGFNRLSLGAQSADDDELRVLGRIHAFSNVKETVIAAKQAGFSNISLDLMYGLPDQTVRGFLGSIEAVLALKPTHLSCYCLKLEEGTPMYSRSSSLTLPDEDVLFEMYDKAAETLETAGFEHYEISNFALNGFRSRHNMKYWNCEEYLGFGPSAHSYINGRRFAVSPDLEGYTAGRKNIGQTEDIDPAEQLKEYLMLRLRLSDGIDKDEFERRFEVSFAPYASLLSRLKDRVIIENGRYRLNRAGFFVSNSIIGELLNI